MRLVKVKPAPHIFTGAPIYSSVYVPMNIIVPMNIVELTNEHLFLIVQGTNDSTGISFLQFTKDILSII
jgi:hypothetical protein